MYNQWNLNAAQEAAYRALAMQQMYQLQQQTQQAHLPPMCYVPVPVNLSPKAESDDSDSEMSEDLRTLFCGNLDDRVTEDLLYEAFIHAGPIEKVSIPRDSSGNSRSFGFVMYSHRCSPPYAIQLLSGLNFFRKPVSIKYRNTVYPTPPRTMTSTSNNHNNYNHSRRGGGGGDNSSLRASNHPAYYDGNQSDIRTSSNAATTNPFRQKTPDWVHNSGGNGGSSNSGGGSSSGGGNSSSRRDNTEYMDRNDRNDRYSKRTSSTQVRPHKTSSPYQRHDQARRNGSDARDRERERDRHGNEYQRRHNYNGNNRRSEQRDTPNRS